MTASQSIRMAVVTVALASGLAACATVRTTEHLLTEAGFRRVPADTPQKLEHLRTLPEHRLVARTHQGQKYYVYADPEGCRCLYMGRRAQYEGYQRLLQARRLAQAEAVDEAREWEIENAGMQ